MMPMVSPVPSHSGGKAVGLRDLECGVGDSGGCGDARTRGVLRQAKMRLRLRPVVETVNALNDVAQLLWNADGAGASAIGSARMLVVRQLNLERFAEVAGLAGQRQGTRAEVDPRERQSEAAGEGQHGLHIRGIGAIARLILFARQALSASDHVGERLGVGLSRAQNDGRLHDRVGIGGSRLLGAGHWLAFTTRKFHVVFKSHTLTSLALTKD